MKSERSQEGSWVGFLDFIQPLVDQIPDFEAFVKIRRPFWRRRSLRFRANRRLPIAGVHFSQDTWELCVKAPGLLPENKVGEDGLTVSELHRKLSDYIESASHCRLVVSDHRDLDKEQLEQLATKHGNEWSGPDFDSLEDGEFLARLDLPVRSVRVVVDSAVRSVTLLIDG